MAGGSSEVENHLSLNANNVFKIQTNVKVTFPKTYSKLSIMLVQAVMRAILAKPLPETHRIAILCTTCAFQ